MTCCFQRWLKQLPCKRIVNNYTPSVFVWGFLEKKKLTKKHPSNPTTQLDNFLSPVVRSTVMANYFLIETRRTDFHRLPHGQDERTGGRTWPWHQLLLPIGNSWYQYVLPRAVLQLQYTKFRLIKKSSRKTQLVFTGSREESLPFFSPLPSILLLWKIGAEKPSQCSFAGKERKNMELISNHSFSFNCVTYSSLNNPRPPSSHPLLHLCGTNASGFAPHCNRKLSHLKNNLPKWIWLFYTWSLM